MENNNENDENNQTIMKIMKIREYHRERSKINYHKRKEAGTLKNYRKVETVKQFKVAPTIEEANKLKYFMNKKKTIKIKVDEDEYNLLLKCKIELEELKALQQAETQ